MKFIKEFCKFTNCTVEATTTFALVPLCCDHEAEIRDETNKFYSKKSYVNEVEARPLYHEIDHLIPWSKTQIESSRGEKENAVCGN